MGASPSPLIGVSTGFTDYGDYLGLAFTRPLVELGAVPVIVPYLTDPAALLARLDGLIFAVGRDIEPARYGAMSGIHDTSYSPQRDASELALMGSAIERGLPILGVCRGMQILNVARGGSLHADHSVLSAPADAHPGGDWERWDEVVRATLQGSPKPEHPGHPIEIAPGSALASVLGTSRRVTSYHHQIARPSRRRPRRDRSGGGWRDRGDRAAGGAGARPRRPVGAPGGLARRRGATRRLRPPRRGRAALRGSVSVTSRSWRVLRRRSARRRRP